MDNKNENKNKNNLPNKTAIIITLISALFIWYMISFLQNQIAKSTEIEKTYSEFMSMLEGNEIEKVTVKGDKIFFIPRVQPNSYDISYYTGNLYDDELPTILQEAYVKNGLVYERNIDVEGSPLLANILSIVLPFIFIYVIMWFLFKAISKNSGGVMGVGKSNAKVYVEKSTGVTFRDVAGQEEAKESLTEIVDFLHNPAKYTRIGAKLPKGALLVGPPGTGKTLLAKAIAGEANVPFFSLTGSDFVEMFVGVGASRVRDLFKQAQQSAPCIIFIDEIDAIGKSRDSHYGGGNDEREQTLNQLLSNMDGFDSSKGLVVLGATNRPEVLDKALLRPGRFDRRIIVDKPDLKGRIDILKVHAKNVLMHDSVDLEAIGKATSGAVGSDLANMINEAAILAVKQGRTVVTQDDLFESVEVVIAGKEKKDRILSKEEKKIVAYHEVGHALVTALQKHAEPVQKITIVPRTMGSLGYVMQVPDEEKYLMSKDDILTRITTLYGGRAAEELVFGSITTGASNDIEKATKLARSMVTQYGMSDKFGLMGLESIESQYLDGRPVQNCSNETAGEIDKEVMKILKECYNKAKELLLANRDVLDKIAEYLITKETITGEEFMNLYKEVKGEDLTEVHDDDSEAAKDEDSSKDNKSEESISQDHMKQDERSKEDKDNTKVE
ncbi:MAG: ATP-dependent zinc metalloprotease FtsH [Clostridiales bacterium]|jgi:cell division protease FtsH|nr:ATP-dependent zinc metalloprotease FtsH [Clostridiales bacterium]